MLAQELSRISRSHRLNNHNHGRPSLTQQCPVVKAHQRFDERIYIQGIPVQPKSKMKISIKAIKRVAICLLFVINIVERPLYIQD